MIKKKEMINKSTQAMKDNSAGDKKQYTKKKINNYIFVLSIFPEKKNLIGF